MPFLIAVTGGQGAGKSTLARMLAARLGGSATLCAGISERVRAAGHPMGQAASDSTILAYAAEHLRREADASDHVITILDRSLIDLDAYASLLGSVPVARLAATLADNAARRYEKTILVPTPSQVAGRAGPDESLEFRKRIADAVEQRIQHFDRGLIVAPPEFSQRPEFVETVAARIREDWGARDA